MRNTVDNMKLTDATLLVLTVSLTLLQIVSVILGTIPAEITGAAWFLLVGCLFFLFQRGQANGQEPSLPTAESEQNIDDFLSSTRSYSDSDGYEYNAGRYGVGYENFHITCTILEDGSANVKPEGSCKGLQAAQTIEHFF